jgi:uncharacterized protein YjbI with pentapeptide repeats
MVLPEPLIKLIKLGRNHQQWPIIIFIISGIITAISVHQPLLWPDGLGFKADKSVTTTIEKDRQGKITKTVETTKTDPGKTLWDWLGLLGVPITLVIFGYGLQQIQQKRTEDESKEEVLQVYIDRLSTLLVDKNLLAIATKVNSEEPEKFQTTQEDIELLNSAVDVIRARTLSILRRFENDEERKTSVIRFLIEADFISKLELDLSDANLSGAKLWTANLSGADLRNVNLSGANLRNANLSGANLSDADLSGAKLWGAKLGGANLSDADLRGAELCSADFSGANLRHTNLSEADLHNANFSSVELWGVEHWSTGSKEKRISTKQIQTAKNWRRALYDPEVSKQLGL